jgi:hypothetical protein
MADCLKAACAVWTIVKLTATALENFAFYDEVQRKLSSAVFNSNDGKIRRRLEDGGGRGIRSSRPALVYGTMSNETPDPTILWGKGGNLLINSQDRNFVTAN